MVGKLNIVVCGETRTCRNLLTNNNVGLEVKQVVNVALDSCRGKNACSTDERCTGEPRINRACNLQSTKDCWLCLWWSTTSKGNVLDSLCKDIAVHVLTKQV